MSCVQMSEGDSHVVYAPGLWSRFSGGAKVLVGDGQYIWYIYICIYTDSSSTSWSSLMLQSGFPQLAPKFGAQY